MSRPERSKAERVFVPADQLDRIGLGRRRGPQEQPRDRARRAIAWVVSKLVDVLVDVVMGRAS